MLLRKHVDFGNTIYFLQQFVWIGTKLYIILIRGHIIPNNIYYFFYTLQDASHVIINNFTTIIIILVIQRLLYFRVKSRRDDIHVDFPKRRSKEYIIIT